MYRRKITPDLLRRRIRDGEETLARIQRKLEADPTSRNADGWNAHAADLDLSLQMWRLELQRREGQ